MLGKAYVSTFQFYDAGQKKMSFKSRPVLVIGEADNTDYVVLPISRITNKANFDAYYDIEIHPRKVPLVNLKDISYIRTHKQTVINGRELIKEIVDFRNEYAELYKKVIERVEEFQKNLVKNAF